jgi:hypothetical protein
LAITEGARNTSCQEVYFLIAENRGIEHPIITPTTRKAAKISTKIPTNKNPKGFSEVLPA